TETGQEVLLAGRTFALRLGQPVRFHLVTSVVHTPERAGDLIDLNEDFVPLPPIVMVLQAATGQPSPGNQQDIPVQLAAVLTEVGTLEMHCVSLADASQRWQLEFDLRHAGTGADLAGGTGDNDQISASRLADAIDKIDRIFGSTRQSVSPKDVTQLRAQLEKILGARAQWTTPVLRQLFDALWQRARGRRRSAGHERVWLNLAGYGLRPGFGDALDAWRVQQLWMLFPLGVQHARDKQVCAEWWTLWRRVAGGLAAPEQLRLLEDFAFNLQINAEGMDDPGAIKPVRGSDEDMLRLGASLERIPAAYKAEIGEWLLARLQKSLAAPLPRAGPDPASDSLHLWALGRIGARQPFYGSPHDVVPADTAADWAGTLLALDWRKLEPAAFAATHLARVTDDRARDLPLVLREQIVARLLAINAPPAWVAMVSERVELDEAVERRMLGESLPPGLKLMP
ncbi:MAG: molecular chaperone DnaK, partial [Polaromonas sp.]|nr:molecular chaperone DnaK [Polaromonas sp.]